MSALKFSLALMLRREWSGTMEITTYDRIWWPISHNYNTFFIFCTIFTFLNLKTSLYYCHFKIKPFKLKVYFCFAEWRSSNKLWRLSLSLHQLPTRPISQWSRAVCVWLCVEERSHVPNWLQCSKQPPWGSWTIYTRQEDQQDIHCDINLKESWIKE